MDFHYSVATEKTVDEAVQSLEESLKANKFSVLWQLDLPAKLHEKGVELDMQYRVLEVCNPHEAKRVLSQNPLVGYFLPCKVVVYQSEGKTHIGLPKPTTLMEVLGDPALLEIAQGVEATLTKAVDEAK
ncbi:DUF302 domain-containing protein [Alicyclobacillus fastidiosus]|uniref:DUF302 domain-containing protein n=1 Tax=Alicyclobacillus fastidiosus TaxID=392011 RepID=A0ABY6ZJU6_9BACL|nr:DUF302 domain-containing protein [Alicyclobacillus fastidiosus]WAH42441.1 DUF302 domain-containing protein [Alicyclobacillus fastidiosus]GMA64267.1 hypothetical protein GCM10025859_47070 [Alicyclobacillus fastidiosus]